MNRKDINTALSKTPTSDQKNTEVTNPEPTDITYIPVSEGNVRKYQPLQVYLTNHGLGTTNLETAKKIIESKRTELSIELQSVTTPQDIPAPIKPIEPRMPNEPSTTVRKFKYEGVNYAALPANHGGDDDYDDVPNQNYQEQYNAYQDEKQKYDIDKKAYDDSLNRYLEDKKKYDSKLQQLQSKNQRKITELNTQIETSNSVLRQLNKAINIPTWKTIYNNFLEQFNSTAYRENPHYQNIIAELNKINRSEVDDNVKAQEFIAVMINAYKNITNSTFYSMTSGDQFAHRLQIFCEHLGFKLPAILENRHDIKYNYKYDLLTNPNNADTTQIFTPDQNDLTSLYNKIKESMQCNWNTQTTLGLSRPDGIEKILSLINKDGTQANTKNVLEEVKTICETQLKSSSFTRSDLTRDFYKSIASIDMTNKHSFDRAKTSIELINKDLKLQGDALKNKAHYGLKR